jgi:hypothetical protein
MKTAYLRALMISVLAGFASQVLASAQTDISVPTVTGSKDSRTHWQR